MPLTQAEVVHPNSSSTEFTLGPFKCKIQTVTFDNSYLTTGEVVTAASLGWDQVHFAIAVDGGIANAAGTNSATTITKANAARTQVTLQAQETAGTVDLPFKEMTSATDLSTYSGRYLFLGT